MCTDHISQKKKKRKRAREREREGMKERKKERKRKKTMKKGGKFLKKPWCCVGGEFYKII